MNRDGYKIGETVYFTEGTVRRNSSTLLEGEVTKVGRKYITVKRKGLSRETRFDKNTFIEVTDYGASGLLYLSKQEYLDEVEYNSNTQKIRMAFDRHHSSFRDISLDQTRRIIAILEEDE